LAGQVYFHVCEIMFHLLCTAIESTWQCENTSLAWVLFSHLTWVEKDVRVLCLKITCVQEMIKKLVCKLHLVINISTEFWYYRSQKIWFWQKLKMPKFNSSPINYHATSCVSNQPSLLWLSSVLPPYMV